MSNKQISVVIPAYNEQEAIENVVVRIKDVFSSLGLQSYEIIVVNDGSQDKTKEIIESIPGIRVINHPYNKGYGASLKTGIKNSSFDWILLIDSDGQHNPEYVREMLKYTDEYDMIVGDRSGEDGPLTRKPAKKILGLLANYLAERKIPDLNSGFRLVKKQEVLSFWHILPNTFSFTTTITLAFFKEGLNVKYVPIKTNKRLGKSSLKPKEAVRFFVIILRTIFLFSPLRIFLPLSVGLFLIFLASAFYDVFVVMPSNITDLTVLLLISSLIIFSFGLLADQIAALRREMAKKDK